MVQVLFSLTIHGGVEAKEVDALRVSLVVP